MSTPGRGDGEGQQRLGSKNTEESASKDGLKHMSPTTLLWQWEADMDNGPRYTPQNRG